MENENLEVVKEKPAPAPKKKVYGKVINGRLNLRQRPSLESDIITALEDGTKVQILNSKNSDFYKVLVNGTEGYCVKKFIAIEDYDGTNS